MTPAAAGQATRCLSDTAIIYMGLAASALRRQAREPVRGLERRLQARLAGKSHRSTSITSPSPEAAISKYQSTAARCAAFRRPGTLLRRASPACRLLEDRTR